jgi:hypothetical protein
MVICDHLNNLVTILYLCNVSHSLDPLCIPNINSEAFSSIRLFISPLSSDTYSITIGRPCWTTPPSSSHHVYYRPLSVNCVIPFFPGQSAANSPTLSPYLDLWDHHPPLPSPRVSVNSPGDVSCRLSSRLLWNSVKPSQPSPNHPLFSSQLSSFNAGDINFYSALSCSLCSVSSVLLCSFCPFPFHLSYPVSSSYSVFSFVLSFCDGFSVLFCSV